MEVETLDVAELLEYCNRGNEDGVKRLLAAFGPAAVLGARDILGMTPLHSAAEKGRENIAALLIDSGADVDQDSRHGLTPLHYAATLGRDNIISLLLERGADPNVKAPNGMPPMTTAATNDKFEAIRLLLAAGAYVDDPPGEALANAIKGSSSGNTQVSSMNAARVLLGAGASLGIAYQYGLERQRAEDKKHRQGFQHFQIDFENNKIALCRPFIDATVKKGTKTVFGEEDEEVFQRLLDMTAPKDVALACVESPAFMSAINASPLILCTTRLFDVINILEPQEPTVARLLRHLVLFNHWRATSTVTEILTAEIDNIPKPTSEINHYLYLRHSFPFMLRFDPSLKHFVYRNFEKRPSIVEKCTDFDINNAVDSSGNTLAHLTLEANFTKGMDQLMRVGFNPLEVNNQGTSPLRMALDQPSGINVKSLLDVMNTKVMGREMTMEKRRDRNPGYSVQVHEGKYSKVEDKVAIKAIFLGNEVAMQKVRKEVESLLSLTRCPNIISYFGVESIGLTVYIAMELADGSLDDLLKRKIIHTKLKPEEMLLQVVSGLEYLHSKDIAHRNLKLENILICGLILKLCDFGKAKLLESLGNTQTRVTLQLLKSDRFASPEALRLTAKDEAYVEREMYQKGDIFSLGSVGKAILTEGEILFTLKSGESDSDVIQNILQWDGKDRSKINLDGLEIYPLLKHLILTMVNTDWRKRPTIQQVKMHFALQEEMFWTQVFEAIKEQFLKDIKINPKTNEPANPKLKEAFDPADENKRKPIIGEKSKWTEVKDPLTGKTLDPGLVADMFALNTYDVSEPSELLRFARNAQAHHPERAPSIEVLSRMLPNFLAKVADICMNHLGKRVDKIEVLKGLDMKTWSQQDIEFLSFWKYPPYDRLPMMATSLSASLPTDPSAITTATPPMTPSVASTLSGTPTSIMPSTTVSLATASTIPTSPLASARVQSIATDVSNPSTTIFQSLKTLWKKKSKVKPSKTEKRIPNLVCPEGIDCDEDIKKLIRKGDIKGASKLFSKEPQKLDTLNLKNVSGFLSRCSTSNKGLLVCAIKIGNEALVEKLLQLTPISDFVDNEYNCLEAAIKSKNEKLVPILLHHGADPLSTKENADESIQKKTWLKTVMESDNDKLINLMVDHIVKKSEMSNIHINKAEPLHKPTGSNRMTSVYKGTYQPIHNAEPVKKVAAIKVICSSSRENMEDQKVEVKAMQLLKEEGRIANIVNVFDSEMVKGKLIIAMDLCVGTLSDNLAGKIFAKKLPENPRLAYQIVNGVVQIHGDPSRPNSVAHLDLKPSNLFTHDPHFKEELEILIGDFGCSEILTEDKILTGEGIGTPCYMSPERLEDVETNKIEEADEDFVLAHVKRTQVDIWACGMVLYVLLSRDHALIFKYTESDGDHEILFNIKNFRGTEAEFKKNLKKLGKYALAETLIRAALELNPTSRPTAKQMLAHPFFMLVDTVFKIIREIHEEINRTREDPDVVPELESRADLILKGATTWEGSCIPSAVVKRMNRSRGKAVKIDTSTVQDLLAVIRNATVHSGDKPLINLEAVFEEFPEFLPAVFHVAAKFQLSGKWNLPTLKELYKDDPYWLHYLGKP